MPDQISKMQFKSTWYQVDLNKNVDIKLISSWYQHFVIKLIITSEPNDKNPLQFLIIVATNVEQSWTQQMIPLNSACLQVDIN